MGVLTEIFKYIKTKRLDSFIIASFAVNPDGYTRKGYYCQDILDEATKGGYVDAAGLNCVLGTGYTLKM